MSSTTATRLPEAFVEELKRRVDVVDLIGEKVDLKGTGRVAYGRCPFHDDQSPSFAVNRLTGRYVCRGCEASGDVFTWLKEQEGMGFSEAAKYLADRVGLALPKTETAAGDVEARRLRGEITSALRQASSIYAYGLERSPEARQYLDDRGITRQTAELFGLGYVASGIRTVLAGRVRDPAILPKAGITKMLPDDREWELLRHRLVVPLKGEQGHLVGFAGRAMPNAVQPGPKYINSPDTVLFQKSNELFGLDLARSTIAQRRSAIVVEGYFDVISLHQAAERRAVATMGTQLSPVQAARLFRDANRVYLCFDGDAAGRSATVAAAKALLQIMHDTQDVHVALLPPGEDPDDIVRRGGADAFDAHLAASRPLSAFIVEVLVAGADPDVPETVAPLSVQASEWLALCKCCPFYGRALRVALERRLGIEI